MGHAAGQRTNNKFCWLQGKANGDKAQAGSHSKDGNQAIYQGRWVLDGK